MNDTPFVLMSGPYAEFRPEAANRLLGTQARAVAAQGVRVEVLTNALDGVWRGPIPGAASARLAGLPYVRHVADGIVHHVVAVPRSWHERTPPDHVWQESVAWARAMLAELRPDVVHQHYWQTLFSVAEAARQVRVPYGYTFYDFGLGCLRTTLVTGQGTICDGVVEPTKCAICLRTGRGLAGWANETIVRLPPGRALVSRLGFGRDRSGPLAAFNAVSEPAEERVASTRDRVRAVLAEARFAVAPSPFAMAFMESLGLRLGVGIVAPWFIDDGIPRLPTPSTDDGIRFGFLGRISREKGLDVLLDAFGQAVLSPRTTLTILGRVVSDYARALQAESENRLGGRVTWDSIDDRQSLMRAVGRLHVLVFPSIWMDNTPAALTESLALGRPAIVTDIPTMTFLVTNGVNGLSFPMGDATALARCLEACDSDPAMIARFASGLPDIPTAMQYATRLVDTYRNAAVNPDSVASQPWRSSC
jgi:glycosyltransferase involved in cell wall biosynthesis